MLPENLLRIFLVLSIFTWNCSAPKPTTQPTLKPTGRELNLNERFANVRLADLDGKPISLSDYAGKPVFLNFWATWCGPCIGEMPTIETVSKQFKDEIAFVAISNEPASVIKSWLKKNPHSFEFVRIEGSFLDAYVVSLPTTMLLDRKGQLVTEEVGFRSWTSKSNVELLRSLLKD